MKHVSLPFLLLFLLMSGLPSLASSARQDGELNTPGDHVGTLMSDGIERRFLLHVPPGYQPDAPTPLLISFHGYLDTPEDHSQYTQWLPKADAENFIVAFPQGQGDPPAWYTYDSAEQDWADDVQFVRDLIVLLQGELNIDAQRIFASGMSNGGGMAGRVGCDLSDIVAAIAPVSASHVYNDPCAPLRALPVLAIHGQQDEIAPYEGQSTLYPNIPAWIREWVVRNGCDATPQISHDETRSATFHSDILIEAYGNCDDNADVMLYTYAKMGHNWPALTAPDFIWDFFEAHPLPEVYVNGIERPTPPDNEAEQLTPSTLETAFQIPPGDYVGTLPGWQRDYYVYVPEGYTAEEPTPLIISFHDFGSDPIRHAAETGFLELADEAGFIAVFPGGSGTPLAFYTQANPPEGFPDDVQMTRDLIAYMYRQFTIDAKRIYVTGFSLGGGMAHRIACELPDVISAAAMVAGGYFVDNPCEAGEAVPVLAIHARDDEIVPYEGSDVTVAIPEWLAGWVGRDGCEGDPITENSDAGVTIEHWSNCQGNAEVISYSYAVGGHGWPEGTAEIIWEFFASHVRQETSQ